MNGKKPSLSHAAPVIAPKKTSPRTARLLPHARRPDARKQALQALEQALRLQSYTIRLPRSRPLFSGSDQRRPLFPSAPAHIARLLKSK